MLGSRHGLDHGPVLGLAARFDDVALLVPRRHQQITSGLHPFVDQRVCQLLGLVEQENGLVGDLFLRIHLSLLQLALSLLQLAPERAPARRAAGRCPPSVS